MLLEEQLCNRRLDDDLNIISHPVLHQSQRNKIEHIIDPEMPKNILSKYKEYEGNLKQSVREQCREFSEIIFKTYTTGFTNQHNNKTVVKQKLQELNKVFSDSGNVLDDYIEYLEFLIKNKGNWEFIIPYYEICSRENHESAWNS